MKCQNCHKRDATVHLTEITKGVKQEIHLCEPCAWEKGLPGKAHFSISDLLAGLTSSAQTKKGSDVQCPTCGITLAQFQSSGRFGCPDCYTAFRDDILPLVEKIHDGSQHVGKAPKSISREIGLQKEIRQLQLNLKRTVKQEDYERAVQLRDQIKNLEKELQAMSVPDAAPAKAPAAEKKAPPKGPASGETA